MTIRPDDFDHVIEFLKSVLQVVNFLLFELYLLILAVMGAVSVIRNHLKK